MARRAALLICLLALLACGGDRTDPNTTVPEDDGGARLTIEGRSFGSAPQLSPGEAMTIVNLDSVRHTFSSADGHWEAVEIAGDSEAQFQAPADLQSGSYRFFCEVHPDMGGSITIGG